MWSKTLKSKLFFFKGFHWCNWQFCAPNSTQSSYQGCVVHPSLSHAPKTVPKTWSSANMVYMMLKWMLSWLLLLLYLYLQATINGKNIYVESTYARMWVNGWSALIICSILCLQIPKHLVTPNHRH